MKVHALLVVDFSKRELLGGYLLKHFLEQLGKKTVICSRFNLAQAYNATRPAAVVLPHAHFHLIDQIAPQSQIFLVPSESGAGSRPAIKLNFEGSFPSLCRTSKVDKVYCWGPKMAEWLEQDGVYPREKLVSYGHPAMDHHLIKRERNLEDVDKRQIGLTTTFLMLNTSQGEKLNPFMWIYTSEKTGGDGIYYDPGKHCEDWIYYEAAMGRLICDIIDTLALKNKWPIFLRPHPMEWESMYDYFVNLSQGLVTVDKSGPISEWFSDISVLMTFLSTSSIDAVYQNVPAISLRKMINPDAYDRIPKRMNLEFERYLWQPEDMNALENLCRDARRGILPNCERLEEANQFIREQFALPRNRPAALSIAEDISALIDKYGRKGAFSPIGNTADDPGYRKIARKFYYNADLFWFYWYSQAKGNMDIGFTYLPWKFKEIKEAKKFSEKIITSLV